MDKKDIYNNLMKIVNDVNEVSVSNLKYEKEIQLVLYNLQIESAHINEANGVSEIAIELKRILDKMVDLNKKLIENDSDLIKNTMSNLKDLLEL